MKNSNGKFERKHYLVIGNKRSGAETSIYQAKTLYLVGQVAKVLIGGSRWTKKMAKDFNNGEKIYYGHSYYAQLKTLEPNGHYHPGK